MSKKQRKSAAIQLLDLAWEHTNSATPHSWERLNNAMREALTLAIGAGFTFAEGDIEHVDRSYNTGRWIGDWERYYALAIEVGNMSATKSFESWKGRQPYIADAVSFRHGSHFQHGGGNRQRERLCVGCTFEYRGLTLRVNSFAADQSYVNAASYKRVPHDDGWDREKLDKRFKLTREDILTERRERKERQTLLDRLTKASENGDAAEIVKALGISKKADYEKLLIEKIRKVAAKFAPENAP